MQEKTSIQNNQLIIEDKLIERGINVRLKGSEISKGDLALPKGSLLSPAAIGFLAGIGTAEVMTIPNPVISIIITGKELQSPGQPLDPGQVFDANSFSLSAILNHLHFENIKIFRTDDDLESLTGLLKVAVKESDLVLLTGGISVGDYDFVLPATENCGIKKLFHKIKQRPGNPYSSAQKIINWYSGCPEILLRY